MKRVVILSGLASILVSLSGLSAAATGMPEVNGTIGNLRVHREVLPSGSVQYWLVEKTRYDKKSDTVNLQLLREGSNGQIMDKFTLDAPCAHRKYMLLETIVDDPLGPRPNVKEYYSSKQGIEYSPISLQMVNATCPKK